MQSTDIKINNYVLENIDIARKWHERLIGLLKTKQSELTGLWINPCQSVHTFFMRYPIDIIFLDTQNTVTKIEPNTQPNKLSFGTNNTVSVLELPFDSIKHYNIKIGDQILFKNQSENAQSNN